MVYETPLSNLVEDNNIRRPWVSVLLGFISMVFVALLLSVLLGHFGSELFGYSEEASFQKNHSNMTSSSLFQFIVVIVWCISMMLGGYVSAKRSPEKWGLVSTLVPVFMLVLWFPLQVYVYSSASITQILIGVLVVPSSIVGGYVGMKNA